MVWIHRGNINAYDRYQFTIGQISLKLAVRSVVVVDSLFTVAPIVCGVSVFCPCFVIQYLLSFLVMGKRELVTLHDVL